MNWDVCCGVGKGVVLGLSLVLGGVCSWVGFSWVGSAYCGSATCGVCCGGSWFYCFVRGFVLVGGSDRLLG